MKNKHNVIFPFHDLELETSKVDAFLQGSRFRTLKLISLVS
jgi:hypothetical protein